jgi:hypothetical protein
MHEIKSDAGIATELQLAISSQEEDRYFPATAPRDEAHDEDAELSSLESLLLAEFIQAVLNSTREAIDAVESSDSVLS